MMSSLASYMHAAHKASSVLLIADHAGNKLPDCILENQRLSCQEMQRHIAWDIGIEGVTRELSGMLMAPAVMAHFSRLWVDLNRAPDDPDCIRSSYDGTLVPFNTALSDTEHKERLQNYFYPYHDIVAKMLREHPQALPVLFHSFTPQLRESADLRPWEIAVLWRDDPNTAQQALNWLRSNTKYVIGDNEPYSLFYHSCFTADYHFAASKRKHLILEIRQDLISSVTQQKQVATLLADMLNAIEVAEPPFVP